MRDRSGVRRFVGEGLQKLVALADSSPENSVHQAAGARGTPRPAALHPSFRQLDRAVNRSVIGAFGEEDLEEPQPQGRHHRSVQPAGPAARKLARQMIARPPPLHGPVSEALGLSALAPLQGVPPGRGRKRPVGPRVVLEHPPQDLEGSPARRRRRRAQEANRGEGLPRR